MRLFEKAGAIWQEIGVDNAVAVQGRWLKDRASRHRSM